MPNESEKLSRDKFYPLADLHPMQLKGVRIKAKWTGEKRTPKKGEYYLSGAVIEAYRAPNDLTTPFHIAKLYQVVTKTADFPIEEIES